jgi:periplasmic protein TonB
MSAITVNAFPPLHAFSSSRSWFLAFIVVLHAGFFWGLTHGVTIWKLERTTPPFVVVDVPDNPRPPPVQRKPIEPDIRGVFVPTPVHPPVLPRDDEPMAPRQVTSDPTPPPPTGVQEGPGEGPRIVEPELDARYPFSEPDYPVSEIRQGHEGTVLLALQILPNGRVGEVRIERSSGYEKLDVSAAREARKWRMKPGTSDGKMTSMWKKVPIKFQLKN